MRLTENMILARAKTSNLGSIRRINLWGCDLTDISIVEDMPNVEVLALSINKLSNLQPLAACAKLQVLYLRKNNIHDFEELRHLQNLRDLKELWLGENPCAANAGLKYRSTVVKMLPNLKKLDDEEITTADIEGARNLNSTKAETKQFEPEVQPETATPPPKVQSAPEPKKTPEKQGTDLIEFELEQQIANINSKQKVKVPELQSEVSQSPQRESPYLQQQAPQRESPYLQQQAPQRESPYLQQQPPQRESPYLQQQPPQHEQLGFSQQKRNSLQSFPPAAEATEPTEPTGGFETQRSRQSLPASFNQMAPVEESQESPVTTIPQLKVVLQIQQPQQTQAQEQQPMNHECSDWNKTAGGGARAAYAQGNYDTYSESAACINKSHPNSTVKAGSRSSRTRVSQGLNNDSGWDSFTSRTNQENKAQRTHQFDNQQASSRSAHINENLTWGDGINTHRSSASRTTSSSSTMNTSRSSRRNANVYSALLCVVPELDLESLQVLEHSIQCRLDELSNQ